MNKGVALYLAVVVMALLLIIVFGLSAVVRNQIIMVRNTEESVVALYAADSGVEKFLIDAVHNIIVPHEPTSSCIFNGVTYNYCANLGEATYYVEVKCCKYTGTPTPGCNASAALCTSGGVLLPEDANCGGRFYCAKSVGAYKGTTRGVSVSI